MKRKMTIRAVGVIAVLAVALGAGSAASAKQSHDNFPRIPEGSVLVTPEEVLLLGGTQEQADLQAQAWADLSAPERRAQEKLSREGRQMAGSAYDRVVEYTGASDPSQVAASPDGLVSPMASVYPCDPYPTWWYKIVGSFGERCFGGAAGTYKISGGLSSTNLGTRPGQYNGRVQYSVWNVLVWTAWRGPSQDTAYVDLAYDQHPTIFAVQLS